MAYIGTSPTQAVRTRFLYTATASQTTFSGADTQNLTLRYSDANFVDVYQNGVLLKGGGADYTATTTTSVVLATGATADDVIEIIVYDVFAVANLIKKDGDTVEGVINFNGKEITLDADFDTSITSDTDDQIDIKIAGADDFRFTANTFTVLSGSTLVNSGNAIQSNAGITIDNITIDGTEIDLSSGDLTLDVAGDIVLDADGGDIQFSNGGTLFGSINSDASSPQAMRIQSHVSDGDIIFKGNDGGSTITAMSIDMSDGGKLGLATGELGIGISERLTIAGNGTSTNQPRIKFSKADSASTGDDFGRIIFNNSANTDLASIGCISASGNTEASLVFHSGGGNTERMRLNNSGAMILGRTDAFTSGGGNTGGNGGLHIARDNERCLFLLRAGGNGEVVNFIRGGITNPVGTISIDTSSTAYNTSSDYRLKENIVTDWDATSRLKQLKPSRFNFKVEKDTTVDGFLAHEVSGIVPEAITGEKDAVDKEGNPEYQGIDQSKLVPLLTKALQEAVAKIETLEAKVTALESK